MNLSGLLPLVDDAPSFGALLGDLQNGIEAGWDRGLGIISAARPYLLAAMYRRLKVPILLLTARAERVNHWTEQLRAWSGSESVFAFPEPDALPYERVPWSRETITDRLTAFTVLARWGQDEDGTDPPLIVASARAIVPKTLPPREFRMGLREYRQGQEIDMQRMLASWVAHGYRPSPVVEEPGTFSRRGGLIDVFPPNLPLPVRIELFGDEIESMRVFEPTSQRSERRIEQFVLAPATEAVSRLSSVAAKRAAILDLEQCHPPARVEYEQDLVGLESNAHFRGVEFYLPFFYSNPATLLAFLPPGGLVVIDDWDQFMVSVMDIDRHADSLQSDLVRAGELPNNMADAVRPYFGWEELRETLAAHQTVVLGARKGHGSDEQHAIAQAFVHGEQYGGQLRRVLDGCQEMRDNAQRVILVSRQARRIAELLADREISVTPVQDVAHTPAPRSLTLVQGTLAQGWRLLSKTTLLTDAEIFGWARPAPRKAQRSRPVAPETFFADMEPGTHVVHIEHGIGLFQGLTKISYSGVDREYLLVEYAAGDKLYVPVYQADRLSRYVGVADAPPRVNRLGTAEWETVKSKAKRAVEEAAEELLALYAARGVVKGHAFQPDTLWQAELEASFPYVETDAQLRALEEIKDDMERARPMDRLVCGDVGYGKTEVAIRAAFKAVMDGKQVAVLVPTTVLAQQHYQTFSERLKTFPVSVSMLSRFLTHKQQEETVDSLARGGVDIVIGTHRMLSGDVRFKDLGLLIIDEEQRFGVAHKERLKQMRHEVDVLTLTATPIPRTLHMSLTGVRDMSSIDTPPEERLPVRTHVGEYDETLIRKAILREIDRGGQVFFVHNRVMGIYPMAQRLRKLVPEATVDVGHGQMSERELERVMLEFAAGNIDVLVCTSIIESGLDIPNANTLIVNRADRFGLAQLYQLKGRVGRGARRAYAYFLHPRVASLSETAGQRLETIAETTELGAGFRIAMRDLEMRGAGELLGSRQHGHIAVVGFDLYTRLLAQAVQQAREQHETVNQDDAVAQMVNETTELLQPLGQAVQINLPLDAYLPETYIADDALRLRLYRRLASLGSESQIDDFRAELEDRFGPLPEEGESLFFQLRLKLYALEAEAKTLAVEEKQIVIRADSLENVDRQWLQRRLGDRGRVSRRAIWVPLDGDDRWRVNLVAALQAIAEGLP